MVKNFFLIGALSLTLAACSPGGIANGNKVVSVSVGGELINVQRYFDQDGVWVAAPDDLSGGILDPRVYRQNVLAIEQVSGCSVDPVTVRNQGLQTIAATIC